MHLPSLKNLPTHKLAASFGNTSATYKFYWLLAIIEAVETGSVQITKRELFARMIANAWYTVNYFHVSFGKQDLIQDAVRLILIKERLTIDLKKQDLFKVLMASKNTTTINTLNHFNKNVPHWFLSPWFSKIVGESDTTYRKRIYNQSQSFTNYTLYALYNDYIEMNQNWVVYLQNNAKILKDFCYWNLALFLQSRNPNVPDIPGKLFKSPFRSVLTNQRKNYWDIVFKELGTVQCIFTNTPLKVDKYALDHFIPHAFVSHDLIWNLIPIETSFNSIKSDRLPSIENHFDKFYNLQKSAFDIIKHYNSKNKLLDEYVSILPDAYSKFDYQKYMDTIQPLITIAQNNGFIKL
jgi:5-methylcytosine-specific restriction endonuclease McrA